MTLPRFPFLITALSVLLIFGAPQGCAENKTSEAQRILEQAGQVTASIKDQSDKDSLLGEIGVAQAQAGDLNRALQTVSKIKDEYNRAYAAANIAMAQVKAGNINGAIQTANVISDKDRRGSVMSSIAITQAE